MEALLHGLSCQIDAEVQASRLPRPSIMAANNGEPEQAAALNLRCRAATSAGQARLAQAACLRHQTSMSGRSAAGPVSATECPCWLQVHADAREPALPLVRMDRGGKFAVRQHHRVGLHPERMHITPLRGYGICVARAFLPHWCEHVGSDVGDAP